MKKILKKLFPICRSITGNGFLKSLNILKKELKELKIKHFRSGEKVFDWKIPAEWNVDDAYVFDLETKKKIIDFKENNLHLVSYSHPLDKIISGKDLLKKIHSLPDQPAYIPYVTSYYKKTWGFCVKHSLKQRLKKQTKKKYRVFINSRFNSKGKMNYGEFYIRGKSKKEILISTYLCHPSMANNELSGPIVGIFVMKKLKKIKLKYSLRFLIIPETIGSISYISKNLNRLKKNVIAGYVLTCLGDSKDFSYLNSREEDTLSDKVAKKYFLTKKIKFKNYSYLHRGSDERQYNSPGVDLPIGSIMRSKYNTYKEYHTSADNLDFVNEKNLSKSVDVVCGIIEKINQNDFPISKIKCEPFLTKYNLYPTTSIKRKSSTSEDIINFLAYCDGNNDLIDISKKINIPLDKVNKIFNLLLKNKIVKRSHV